MQSFPPLIKASQGQAAALTALLPKQCTGSSGDKLGLMQVRGPQQRPLPGPSPDRWAAEVALRARRLPGRAKQFPQDGTNSRAVWRLQTTKQAVQMEVLVQTP